ncbi:SusC/RagA family TonB-linked outer membrane protein [Arachidicoccus rhizosphaerae]|nr:TonB-dependent receptor [Arachidicoccus rhizosphaerae]
MTKIFNLVWRKSRHKIWLKMRLTTLLVVACCMQLSAKGVAQNVSIKAKQLTVAQFIREIHRQTGYQFFFNDDLIKNAPDIKTVPMVNVPLEVALKNAFAHQDFSYKIVEKTITLLPEKKQEPTESQAAIQPKPWRLTGTVTDSTAKALSGVSVRLAGTGKGTISNGSGAFSLFVNEGDVLEFSYIGYKNISVTLNSEASYTSGLHITLQADQASSLNDLVVVGFGKQKKINLTGAISQISGKDLENRPVSNIGQALQGLMPNVNISIANGSPNTTPSINIRGGTSFAKNSSGDFEIQTGSPYTLVDGIPMDISQVNPEDIETVTVLKDAASSAIYGARAAYGVMLITTKKGTHTEKPVLSYSNDFQWNRPAARPDLLNAYEIQQASNDAYAFTGQSVPSDQVTKLEAIKAYMADPVHNSPYIMSVPGNDSSSIIWVGNQNPYDEAVKSATPMMKHNLSISGGSEKTTYYASVSYLGQQGIYKMNTDKFQRYNANFNLNTKVTNWFSMEFKTNYYNTQYKQPVYPSGKGGWWRALAQEPGRNINMPLKTPADAPFGMGGLYTDNILSFMDYGSLDQDNTENLLLAASPTFQLTKDWKIKGDISYTSNNYRGKTIIPELDRVENSWLNTDNVYTSPSSVSKTYNHFNQYLINLYSDYSFSKGGHNLYGLVGFNQEWYSYDELDGSGNDIITPEVPAIDQTTGERTASDGVSSWAVRGAFYRLTYNYKGKYLLESNGRYDLTSKFPTDSRGKFFPSISAGWRIGQEGFMQGLKPALTDLKLRGSYGSIGNQNVSNYIYIPSYGTTAKVSQLFDGKRPVGVYPPGLVDPNITWETAATLDFGMDMTLFNKLDISFDWYNRTTSDILVDGDKFPAVLGAASPTKNSGELKTVGWDLTVGYKDRTDYGLNYSLNFVLSDYQTEITKFDNNPNMLLSTLYVGQKMGDIWGYQSVGIFQNQDQIDKATSQKLINSGVWYPGDMQYANLNGDSVISGGAGTLADHGDRRIIGNSTPRYQFGLNSNFSWNGFDLNIFFQGVGKRDVYISDNLFWGAIAGGSGTREVYENSWTPDRPSALYPAYRNASKNIITQTRFLQNAAYIRLKNLTLGYTLPQNTVRRLGLQKIRVYGAAYNLWQYSKVPDIFDPELLSANYPMIKSLAVGLQVNF